MAASYTLAPGALAPSAAKQLSARRQLVQSAVAAPRAALRANPARRVVCQAAKDPVMQLTEDQNRWESQVRDGRVKNVTTREVGQLMKEGWVLLDVRPEEEVAKAKILGAVEVPIYQVDKEVSISSAIKHATAFGMGGWWLGGSHMIPNQNFMAEVLSQVPKDAKVVVACQKGLRSLAACESLSRAGYGQLAWINGGFDTAKPGDLPTKDNTDIRMAGIGGLSEFLGWTVVQKESTQNKGFLGGSENIIKFAIVILVIDLAWFGLELFQAWQNNNLPIQQ